MSSRTLPDNAISLRVRRCSYTCTTTPCCMTPSLDTHLSNDHRQRGLAILVVEADEHAYEPVAVVSTIAEAAEIGRTDLRARSALTERGKDVLCPSSYIVWAANTEGWYERI